MPRVSGVNKPSLRLHKSTGQAVVTIAGRDHYLGTYGSKASKAAYRRAIQEWIAAGRPTTLPAVNDATLAELIERYQQWVEPRYVRDGLPTGEAANIGLALRPVRTMYGNTRAIDFTAEALEAIQQKMIDNDLCANTINQRVRKIKRFVRWGVKKKLIPGAVRDEIQAVFPVDHRDGARQTSEVQPVDDATIEATLAWLPEVVADMVRLQRLTGCRPGEICLLRPWDVDTTAKPAWVWRPPHHKTSHLKHERIIYIGPRGQDLLRRYLLRAHDAYCFSPSESERKRRAARHEARKTPLSCGNRPGSNRKASRKHPHGESYDSRSYAHAVSRAIKRANRKLKRDAERAGLDEDEIELVKHWHPHQLRHSAASEFVSRFDFAAASSLLGHRDLRSTRRYVKDDGTKAAACAAAIG